MEKISAVYKIVNEVTGDTYVGSSKDVKHRWAQHKIPSTWKEHPNSTLYKDFQKYGIENFRFQILAPVIPEYLKQVEQEFIDMIHPTYNKNRANGWDVERVKEYQRKYSKGYRKTNKGKEINKKAANKYYDKLCYYKGKTLRLIALIMRFKRTGIIHPTQEAKKYLIKR